MSYYSLGKDDLAEMIKTASGASAVINTDFNVLGVLPTTTAEQSATGKNTKVMVQMVNTARLSSKKKLYYDRLDLSKFASFNVYKLPAGIGTTLYNNLPLLRDMFGMQFGTDDIEDATIVDDGTGSGAGTALIKAKAGSLAWTGQFQAVFQAPPNISTLFVAPYLVGF